MRCGLCNDIESYLLSGCKVGNALPASTMLDTQSNLGSQLTEGSYRLCVLEFIFA